MTARGVLLVIVLWLVGCASNPARPSGMPEVAYCDDTIEHWQVRDCAPSRLLSPEIQARRALTYRVTRDASRRVALVEVINGVGRLVEVRSDDCASWAYSYNGDEDIPTEVLEKDPHGKVLGITRVSEAGAKVEWLDASRKPSRRDTTTMTIKRVTYDERGRELRSRFFNGRGAAVRDGDGVYGYDYTVTEDGLVSGWTVIGADGKPTVQDRWSTIVEVVRNASGARVGRRPKDANGAPVIESNGVAGYDQELDEVGNLIRQTNRGLDGRPIADEHGVAITALERNAHGELIRLRYLDVEGHPSPSIQGNGGWDATLDDRGNVVAFDIVDPKGALMVGFGGFARKALVVDADDRVTEERFLDVAGAPTTTKAGVASISTTYDARGNLSETRNFDRKGRLVRNKEGWAIRRCSYDDADRQIGCETFDAARRPAIVRDGYYSRVQVRHDEQGAPVEWRWSAEGASGPPRVHGGSKRVVERDELGSIVSDAYFDERTAPPVAERRWLRARRVPVRRQRLRDPKFAYRTSDGSVGKVRTIALDPHGWSTSEEETGADGAPASPIFRTVFTRDARGLIVGIAYFGADGAPAAGAEHVARRERAYDASGRLLRERHFGVDGKPLEGVSGVERVYDPFGRQTSETWIDGKGAPGGTIAARRVRSSSGSRTIAHVPSRHGFLSSYRSRASASAVSRSCAIGGRARYRQSRSRRSRSPAGIATFAIHDEPCDDGGRLVGARVSRAHEARRALPGPVPSSTLPSAAAPWQDLRTGWSCASLDDASSPPSTRARASRAAPRLASLSAARRPRTPRPHSAPEAP
ncbi:MAG: hypothetical protein U0414_10665 [Polyangiaceae bacterium]